MSEGTPPPPPPPSDSPYGTGGAPPPPPPPNQPTPGPGGYSAAPPPPPPVPGAGGYSAPEAFSYGWAKFKAKPADLLVPMLVVLLVIIVLEVIVQFLLYATILGTHDCTQTVLGTEVQTQCGPGLVVSLIGVGIAGFVVSLVAQMLGAGLIKNALNVVDDKPVSLSEIAAWATKPQVIVAALIVAGATAVGSVLCYIPGIIAGFLLNWTMFYVVDEDMAPMDAAKASVKFVTDHLGDTIVFYLLAILVLVLGVILCLVGLLVAAPVMLIAAAYTFRLLNGRQVSPAPA